jgi:acyl-CoA hydrolase/GNAT superfamily N-acetyltransferase
MYYARATCPTTVNHCRVVPVRKRDVTAAKNWQDVAVSAAQAVEAIPPGATVYIGGGCAVPEAVVKALEASAQNHPGTRLLHHIAILVDGPFSSALRHRSMVVGPDDVELAAQGRAQYLPILINEVPYSMFKGRVDVDVTVVQVSAPDEDGMCSLGISVGMALAAIERSRIAIAEINPDMPLVQGQALVPFDAFDTVVKGGQMLAQYQPRAVGGDAQQVARYVARLVADGSTLHVGLGEISLAVLRFLDTRRDLGIHTEVVTDAIIDLVDEGVVNGRKKSMSRGRIVASLAMGSSKLYDRVADESLFSFRPIDQVADLDVVLQQHRMVSIAQAFSADLTGQICAEAVDGHVYGGVGALPLFHLAAARSPGGRAIICLPSVDAHGRSSIRSVLDPNEAVTIPRYDVRWVVTEFGAAYLHSQTLSERAVAMIEIAHPDHRPSLLSEAKRLGLVPPDQKMRSRRDYPVEEQRTINLTDGTEVLLRPTVTTDAQLLQALFYELKPEDVYTRFFRNLSSLTRQAAEHLCSVSYEDEMAFAAVVGDAETGERIIATSSYFVNAESGLADVAYMVSPSYQGQGLGTALHLRTVEYAKESGLRGFTADILEDNAGMRVVFARGPGHLNTQVFQGVCEIELLFDEPTNSGYSRSSLPGVEG